MRAVVLVLLVVLGACSEGSGGGSLPPVTRPQVAGVYGWARLSVTVSPPDPRRPSFVLDLSAPPGLATCYYGRQTVRVGDPPAVGVSGVVASRGDSGVSGYVRFGEVTMIPHHTALWPRYLNIRPPDGQPWPGEDRGEVYTSLEAPACTWGASALPQQADAGRVPAVLHFRCVVGSVTIAGVRADGTADPSGWAEIAHDQCLPQ